MEANRDKNKSLTIAVVFGILIGAVILINLYADILKKKSQYVDIRFAAIKALEKFKDDSVLTVLKKALSERNPLLRLALLDTIIALGDDSVIPLVSKELNNKDNPFRIIAANILNKIGRRHDAPRYLALLNSENQKERILAIRILGELGYEEANRELSEQLKAEDVLVKSAALESLGKLKQEESITLLKEALFEGEVPKIRSSAVVALAGYKKSRINKYLLEALSDEDSQVREYIMSALVESEDTAVVPEVLKLLRDFDANIRLRACEAVGNLGDKSNIIDLVEILDDPVPKVRYYAAKAIIKLSDKSVVPILLPWLESKVMYQKISAIIGMGRFGDDTAVAFLENYTRAKDKACYFSLAALYNLGQTDSLLGLLAGLKDKNSAIRENATNALPELNATYASLLPKEVAQFEGAGTKIATINLLKAVEKKEAVLALNDYLNDKNLLVRAYAAKAMGELATKLTILTMIKDLDENNISIFGKVSPLLYTARGYTSLKDIIEKNSLKLRDEDPNVRANAIRILAATGDKSVLKILEPFVKDESPIVRTAAVESIAGFNLQEYIPMFIEALKDKDKNVKFSAVLALSRYSPEYADRIVPALTRIAIGKI